MSLLDKMRAALNAGENPIPLGDLMGFRATAIGAGVATIEMLAGPEHYNPMGTVHGGVCCTLADTAMGIAHASLLEDGETSTSLEIKINFIRPIWKDTLTAKGRAVKHGRTVSLDGVRCGGHEGSAGGAGEWNVHDAARGAGGWPVIRG